ncbi:hypothetical protein N7486_000611 [Penicillium sp. IBT 16267x]|nr:hypothetical protein N7486_000611 [Penicillium sp. IBT 16267x]
MSHMGELRRAYTKERNEGRIFTNLRQWDPLAMGLKALYGDPREPPWLENSLGWTLIRKQSSDEAHTRFSTNPKQATGWL